MADQTRLDKIKRYGEKGKVKKLLPYTTSEDGALRAAAATALGSVPGDDAFNALVSMIRDHDMAVRIEVVKALKHTERASAMEFIRRASEGANNAELTKVCSEAVSFLRKVESSAV